MLQTISNKLESHIFQHLNQCGLMFRLFSRVKTISSLHHKMQIKGDSYKTGKMKIQDIIGLRIVLYFQDDVDALAFFYSCGEVVKSSIDALDTSTSCPQRLKIFMRKERSDWVFTRKRSFVPSPLGEKAL